MPLNNRDDLEDGEYAISMAILLGGEFSRTGGRHGGRPGWICSSPDVWKPLMEPRSNRAKAARQFVRFMRRRHAKKEREGNP